MVWGLEYPAPAASERIKVVSFALSPPGMLRDVVPPVAVVSVLASLFRFGVQGSSEAELELAAQGSGDKCHG